MAVRALEQLVYDAVKDNVVLKSYLKWAYQFVGSTLSRAKVDTSLRLVERPGTFFGFHDKSPWSPTGRLLLGHGIRGMDVGDGWRRGEPVEITVFDGEDWAEETVIAETAAWNWQQGSQLQWMGSDNEIIYNDFRDGACRAVFHDVTSQRETVLQFPVAAVSPDGAWTASICFETLGEAMDGYGYAFAETGSMSNVEPATLLIQPRDRDQGKQMRIELEDLDSNLDPPRDEGIDFFSHCLFSPDGTRLLFLRRHAIPNRRLQSELFCVSLKDCAIRRIGFYDMVSHFSWVGTDRVVAFANTEEAGDGFYLVDLATDAVTDWSERLNRRDGHPHTTPDGSKIVFDTYPDRKRDQRLFLWTEGDEQATELARIPSPMKYWDTDRVDLHPRIRQDGAYIAFDAGYLGKRSLVTARLPNSV
jgi:hypothetical protein